MRLLGWDKVTISLLDTARPSAKYILLQSWVVWFCQNISSLCKILISKKADSIQTSQTCHSVSFDTRNCGINLSLKIQFDVTKVSYKSALSCCYFFWLKSSQLVWEQVVGKKNFEVLMRGDAGWRRLPVERFLDFPGVGSVYRAPPHTMQPPVLGSKSWSTKG